MSRQRAPDSIVFNKRSVSPVVATILMVAVVIVIAASIGAVTFGFTDRLGGTDYAASGQCGVTEFDPANVDAFADDRSDVYDVDCVLWFEAASLDKDDGESVGAWNDRSGNQFDATTDSNEGLSAPIWRSNVDGIDAVEFDGDEGLTTEISTADVGIDGDSDFSQSVIIRVDDEGHDGTVTQFGIPNSGAEDYFRYGYNGNFPDTPWFISLGNGGFAGHEPTSSESNQQWSIITYIHRDGEIQVYLNGELREEELTEYDISDDPIQIGFETDEDGDLDSSFFDGTIAEIVIFERPITDNERQLVECQMVDKYDGAVSAAGC